MGNRKALDIRVRIKYLCEKYKVTQKQLAEMTGLREADMSIFANNTRTTFNREKLCQLAEALQITDMNELVEIIWS